MGNTIIRRVTTSEQENIESVKGTKQDEVEKDIVIVKSGISDAVACAKALSEIYPRNTVLKVMAKDDNSDLATLTVIKGKKPASHGSVNADNQPDTVKPGHKYPANTPKIRAVE